MDSTPASTASPPGPADLGRFGEALAERYLRDQGWQILARNWRCPHGELDIVALDGSCLVAAEVKTRRGVRFGEPVEAVTWAKAARLRRCAGAFVQQASGGFGGVRIDVLGLLLEPGRPVTIRHVRGVGS